MDPSTPALVGAIVVLAGALARSTRQRKAEAPQAPRDFPMTRDELRAFVDERISHKRHNDIMVARPIVEKLAEGHGADALEDFDRMFMEF